MCKTCGVMGPKTPEEKRHRAHAQGALVRVRPRKVWALTRRRKQREIPVCKRNGSKTHSAVCAPYRMLGSSANSDSLALSAAQPTHTQSIGPQAHVPPAALRARHNDNAPVDGHLQGVQQIPFGAGVASAIKLQQHGLQGVTLRDELGQALKKEGHATAPDLGRAPPPLPRPIRRRPQPPRPFAGTAQIPGKSSNTGSLGLHLKRGLKRPPRSSSGASHGVHRHLSSTCNGGGRWDPKDCAPKR